MKTKMERITDAQLRSWYGELPEKYDLIGLKISRARAYLCALKTRLYSDMLLHSQALRTRHEVVREVLAAFGSPEQWITEVFGLSCELVGQHPMTLFGAIHQGKLTLKTFLKEGVPTSARRFPLADRAARGHEARPVKPVPPKPSYVPPSGDLSPAQLNAAWTAIVDQIMSACESRVKRLEEMLAEWRKEAIGMKKILTEERENRRRLSAVLQRDRLLEETGV